MALTTPQTATATLLALGVGISGFLDWVDGRSVRAVPARDLFSGSNDRHSSILTSLAAVLVVAAVTALACSLARSRALTIAVAVVILAIDVLWATLEAVHRAPSDFVAAGHRARCVGDFRLRSCPGSDRVTAVLEPTGSLGPNCHGSYLEHARHNDADGFALWSTTPGT